MKKGESAEQFSNCNWQTSTTIRGYFPACDNVKGIQNHNLQNVMVRPKMLYVQLKHVRIMSWEISCLMILQSCLESTRV